MVKRPARRRRRYDFALHAFVAAWICDEPVRDSRSRGGSDERDSDVLTTGDSPRTRLGCFGLGLFGLGALAGPFDEFAVDEGRASADQGDEVGCVDGAGHDQENQLQAHKPKIIPPPDGQDRPGR